MDAPKFRVFFRFFAINAKGPYNSFADLAAISKATPDKLNYATYGSSLVIMTAAISNAAGIKARELKFNKAGDAAKAVAAGLD